MKNLLDDNGFFYHLKLPLEKTINLDCFSFYKYQPVSQNCITSWKLSEALKPLNSYDQNKKKDFFFL